MTASATSLAASTGALMTSAHNTSSANLALRESALTLSMSVVNLGTAMRANPTLVARPLPRVARQNAPAPERGRK